MYNDTINFKNPTPECQMDLWLLEDKKSFFGWIWGRYYVLYSSQGRDTRIRARSWERALMRLTSRLYPKTVLTTEQRITLVQLRDAARNNSKEDNDSHVSSYTEAVPALYFANLLLKNTL